MQGELNMNRIKIPITTEKQCQKLGAIFLEEGWCVHIGKDKLENKRNRFYIEIWKE